MSKFQGVVTIFDHKKWVFAYVVLGLSFWKMGSGDILSLLMVLIPVTIGASSFDKSQWRVQND